MKTLDERFPALCPEIIADLLTHDRKEADALCERARLAWFRSRSFHLSFKRRDERAVLAMWFEHWLEASRKRGQASTPTTNHQPP